MTTTPRAFIGVITNRARGIAITGLVISAALVPVLGFKYGLSPDEALTGTVIALTVLMIFIKAILGLASQVDAPVPTDAHPEHAVVVPNAAFLVGTIVCVALAVWLIVSAALAGLAGPTVVVHPLASIAGWVFILGLGMFAIFVLAMLMSLAWKYRWRIAGEFQSVFLRTGSELHHNMRSRAAH